MKSGRIWQVLILLLAGSGGGQVQGENSQSSWEPDPRPMAKTLVYECPDEYEFVARVGPGEMAVWLEDRYLVLSRVRSASGAKYREGDVVFWLKGDEALLSDGEQQHLNCLLVPARAPWEDARRRGVAFRAVGNEPGWHLEISQSGDLVYAGAYGTVSIEITDSARERHGNIRIFHGVSGEHALRVEIVEGVCTDTMKGDSFPAQVLLQVDRETYQGCGRYLAPLVGH